MTTACEHLRQLGAYALGALDVDEAAEVRRHLRECPECAAEREALAPLPGLLSVADGAEAAVDEPLSAAFEERLLDAYAREHAAPPPARRRRTRRCAGGCGRAGWPSAPPTVVAAAAAALAAFVVARRRRRAPRRATTWRSAASAPPRARAPARTCAAARGGTTRAPVGEGPAARHGRRLRGAVRRREWTASAGTFRTDADGQAYVVLTTALRKGEYNGIRIVRRAHRADGRLVKRAVLAARLS